MKIIQIAKKLVRDVGTELYYCGESSRSIIRKKKLTDVELVAKNTELVTILRYFKRHFNKIKFKRNKGKIIIIDNGYKGIIRLPRDKDGKSHPNNDLRQDSLNYTFTIDALYIPLHNRRKITNIIDYVNGRDDIKNRLIRTIGNAHQVIKADPVIMLDALALSAELNYKLTNNLFYAIKANSLNFDISLDVNRVRKDFITIVMSNKSAKIFRLLYSTHLLYKLIPELALCHGVTQNPKYHKYDVFTHCILACQYAAEDLTIKLAALLHDIAKAQVRKEITKNGSKHVVFYKHEVEGYKLTKKILRRFKFDRSLVEEVAVLVYNHMYNYDHGSWTDAAVRRFIRRVGISENDLRDLSNFPLFLVRRADRLANGANLAEISHVQELFEARIKKVFKDSTALSLKDLAIGGKDLISVFNLEPGPIISKVLNHLLDLVIEDQNLNKRELLLEEAQAFIDKVK